MFKLTDLYKQLKEEATEGPQSQYKIYCDMDGVLVDFDKGYQVLTGKETHHVDVQGKNEFWDAFRSGLENKKMQEKDYWANLQWMPEGQKLWDYIKPHNPTLLSAPSRQNESRLGKRLWVKNNIPGTKLVLANAVAKQNYSGKNKILIDDREDNIEQWKSKGGIGILFKSTDQVIDELKQYGL